jgi:uncharacterized protein YerC
MPPVSKRIISPKISKNINDLLINSFSKTRGKNDLLPFISDLLTPTEKVMVSKRLAIAFLLLRKDIDHRQIAKVLKVSTGTIARVNIVLNTEGVGYRNVLNKILNDENLKLLLAEVYDLFTPTRGIDPEAQKSYRRHLKRDLKSF